MTPHRKKESIGITSTIPVEIVYASHRIPVDLNNVFITDKHPQILVEEAERIGMPRNACTWVKGIYSVLKHTDIHKVIGVVQGDCTHVVSMLQTLMPDGIQFIPFSYPYDQNRQVLRWEMQKLMDFFGIQWDDVTAAKKKLDVCRKQAHELDRMTWEDNVVSSADNLDALINCTDFTGNPEEFEAALNKITAKKQAPYPASMLRLGLIGVPGVFSDLYPYLEFHGARVVFHEVARQFAMPDFEKGMLEQTLSYTYPYSFMNRIKDIQEQSRLRHLDGYLHYVQSFCHHQLEDTSFRRHLDLPMLTIEGDRIGSLDGRIKTRLEAFLHLLRQRRRRREHEAGN